MPGKRTKAKPGPKPKIGNDERNKVIGILTAGGSLADAAALIGVNGSTLRRLKQNDPQFAQGVKQATTAGKLLLIQRVGESPQWQAAAWMLERRWGKEFGRREPVKIEHTGANGGPIETKSDVKHSVDYEAIERELAGMGRRTSSNN